MMESQLLTDLQQQINKARNELKNIRQQQQKLKAEMCQNVKMINSQLAASQSCAAAGFSCSAADPGVSSSDPSRPAASPAAPSDSAAVSSVSAAGHAVSAAGPSCLAAGVLNCKPIGWIHSMYKYKNGTPRQANVCDVGGAYLSINTELFNNPAHCLQGLEKFSHVWLMFVFHKNNNEYFSAKVRPPRLDGERVGLFSTRTPHRPNPIGLSLAAVDHITDGRIYFRGGIDLLDGTPVIDIKPYIPQYDSPCTLIGSALNSQGCSDAKSTVTTQLEKIGADQSSCIESEKQVTQQPGESHVSRNELNCTVNTDGRSSEIIVLNHKDSDKKSSTCMNFDRCYIENLVIYNNASKSNSDSTFLSKENVDKSSCTNIDDRSLQNISNGNNIEQSDSVYQINPNGSQSESSINSLSTNEVQVAEWIANPIIPQLQVLITNRALDEIKQFSKNNPDESFRLKHLTDWNALLESIRSILGADARSVYRRKRCTDRLHYLVVDGVRVTSWYDENGVVEVLAVRPESHE